jgi:hypothetical protein
MLCGSEATDAIHRHLSAMTKATYRTPFSMVCKHQHSLPEGINAGRHTYSLESTYALDSSSYSLELYISRYGSLAIRTPYNIPQDCNSVEVTAELTTEQIARGVRSLLSELLRSNLDSDSEAPYRDLLQFCADRIAPEMARRSVAAAD